VNVGRARRIRRTCRDGYTRAVDIGYGAGRSAYGSADAGTDIKVIGSGFIAQRIHSFIVPADQSDSKRSTT